MTSSSFHVNVAMLLYYYNTYIYIFFFFFLKCSFELKQKKKKNCHVRIEKLLHRNKNGTFEPKFDSSLIFF